jgi:hypothetical protein
VNLLGGSSVDGQPCSRRGTPGLYFSMRPCASERLNFSASMLLLSGTKRYV